MVPTAAKAPRVRIPRLSGSSKSELSYARRRALQAVEREIELPNLERERAGLRAPNKSTQRRVPLAGAEILRRYDRAKSAAPLGEPAQKTITKPSPSTSKAVQRRVELASKLRGNPKKKSSSSKGALSSSGKTVKTISSAKTKAKPASPNGAGPMSSASSSPVNSNIHNVSKSFSGGGGGGDDDFGHGGGDGSDGGGWDDNFGDGSDGHNSGNNGCNNGCNNCNNNHWCNDHWHGGWNHHWGWWPNWSWHGGWGYSYGSWCGWYGWYGWYRSPLYYRYYGYGPWWNDSYYAPTVVTSTIHTTEIIEIPVVQEVQAPVNQEVIAGAEVGSPAEVQSALQRAAVEYLSLGDRAFAEERYGDAVRHYARAIECSPKDPVLHLVLSDALFATGDYHYAAHCLRRALELQPDLLEVEFDKRNFYGDPSGFDHHILLLEGFLTDHVLDDDARLLLGANYLFGGDPDGTVTLFSDTFGEAVRNSDTGRLLLAAAQRAIAAR